VSETAVADLRRAALAPVSISQPRGPDENDFGDLLADDADADPALLLANDAGASDVASALSGLDARGRRILELRYGFDGQAPRTLTEVADELGVSCERVRRLETKTLCELRGRPEVQALWSAA
jgi:RNA polymerase primary sigma factor